MPDLGERSPPDTRPHRGTHRHRGDLSALWKLELALLFAFGPLLLIVWVVHGLFADPKRPG